MNGQIEYSSEPNNATYMIGTLAKYMCSIGYALIGEGSRTCSAFDQEDTVGDWTLTAPSCQCKIHKESLFLKMYTPSFSN